MTTVLFVKVNNRPASQAVSVKLYKAFLASYKKSHLHDTINVVFLFKKQYHRYKSVCTSV
ncbi:hypothetical protein BAMA_04150 [Bacillus manliponensis]|uniref:Uncharacterized protein n=1 Tax=Bacillus manliponensis TaxID=574376 RepID=A0A073JWR3_9BACI|nr:hypothetical protein BAMA_04150 [Bacillus manliponensis]